uniref:Polyprotein n=1 Tax=Lagerstroemia indica cheravirus TaxID=3115784 RepID=A0AAT9JAW3_9SECO
MSYKYSGEDSLVESLFCFNDAALYEQTAALPQDEADFFGNVLQDVLETIADPIIKRGERALAAKKSLVAAGIKARLARARAIAEFAPIEEQMKKNILPEYLRPLPPPTKEEIQAAQRAESIAAFEADYGKRPTSVSSCLSGSHWELMELQYKAHVGENAFGLSAQGVRNLQRKVLRKAASSRAYAQRALKRALRREALIRESEIALIAAAGVCNPAPMPEMAEEEELPAERPKSKATATSKKVKKARRGLYCGTPEQGSCPVQIKTLVSKTKVVLPTYPSGREEGVPALFSDLEEDSSSVCSEEHVEGICCKRPLYMDNFWNNFSTDWECPWVFGILHFDEDTAQSFLFELMQAKTPMGVHAFELATILNLEDLHPVGRISSVYSLFVERYRKDADEYLLRKRKISSVNKKIIEKVITARQCGHKNIRLVEERKLKALKAEISATGNGIGDLIKSLKASITEAFMTVYDRVKSDLTKALVSFFSRLGSFQSLFWDTVNWIEEKIKNILDEHWFASLVGFSLVSSFCLFLSVCIVVGLFFKLCTWLGTGGATCATIVVMAAGAYLGCLGLTKLLDMSFSDLVMKIVDNFTKRPEEYEQLQLDGPDAVGNSPGFGLTFVDSLFAPFILLIRNLIPVKIVEREGLFCAAGKMASNLSACTRVKDTFVSFGKSVLEYTNSVFDAISGKSVGHIAMISRLLDLDFSQWCSDVETYCLDTYESLVIPRMARLQKLRHLVDAKATFEPFFLDPTKKMPTIACSMYWKASELLSAAMSTVSICKYMDRTRQTPFSVWFYGGTGCGKSKGVQLIYDKLLDRLGYPKTSRYFSRKSTTEYWDNYEHQPVVVFDDLGCKLKTEEDWFECITDIPVPVHMAALKEKGRIFTSDFIVATSNLLSVREDSELADRAAFDSRRHVLVECRKNANYRKGVSTNKDYTQYTLRSSTLQNYPYVNINGEIVADPIWWSQEEFIDFLFDSYKEHQSKQEAAEANSVGDEGFESVAACKQYFSCVKKFLNTDSVLFKDNKHSLHDFWYVIDMLERYDPDTHFCRWKDSLIMSNEEKDKYAAIMLFLDTHLPEEDCFNLVSALPFLVRGKFFTAILSDDDYPLECLAMFSGFERFLFHKVRGHIRTRKNKAFEFSLFLVQMRQKLVKFYNKVLENSPIYVKFLLSIGFFFLFGYGFYKACVGIKTFATSLGALGAALAVGNGGGDSMSSDNKTKAKTKSRDHSYVKSTSIINPLSGFKAGSWALDSEAEYGYGNTPEEEYELEDPVISRIEDNFSFVKPYLVVLSDVTDKSNPRHYFGYHLGGHLVMFVGHVWDFYVRSGDCRYRCHNDSATFYLYKTRISTFYVQNFDLVIVKLPECVPMRDCGGRTLLAQSRGDISPAGPFYSFCPQVGIDAQRKQHIQWSYRPMTNVKREFYYSSYDVAGTTIPASPGFCYEAPLTKGCCGVVGFCPTTEGAKPRVCLMHDSDSRASVNSFLKRGHGMFLSLEDIAGFERLENVASAVGNCPTIPCDGLREQNVVCIGKVAYGSMPRYSKNTQLEPSLISKIVEVPNTTVPAIISNSDPRIAVSSNPSFDVFEDGMRKYATVAGPFDGEGDEGEDFQDALNDIFECLEIPNGSLTEVTEEVALQGVPGVEYFDPIVSDTSEGWPWVLQRPIGCKGKSWLLDGPAGAFTVDHDSPFGKSLDKMEKDLVEGISPPLTGIECPKDERVALKKVTTKPKTRLFTVLPFEYNLLVRKYFLTFVAAYMSRHRVCPGKVGMNVHCVDWTNLCLDLKSVGNNWFNGDFERFDGITPRDIVFQLVRRINSLYSLDGCLPNANRVRTSLMMMSSERYGIAGDRLYRVTGGIPSGFPLTVIINSLVNEFFLRFSWKRLSRKIDPSIRVRGIFEKNVRFAVYGDDNLVSVSDLYSSFYNLVSISSFLAQKGVTLKNGQDKDQENFAPFSKPEQCDFLKRRMVKNDRGMYLCPLNIDSIYGQLHWVRKSGQIGEATLQNCQGALREAFYHGTEVFHQIRRTIVESFSRVGLDSTQLPTYQECESAYYLDNSPNSKYSPLPDLPKIIIPCTSMMMKVADGVYLAGYGVSASALPSGQVVVCGPSDLKKPFVTHRLVTSSFGGYCVGPVVRRIIRSLDRKLTTVFISPDGLSQAIPPCVLFLRLLYGPASSVEMDLLSRVLDNKPMPKAWEVLLSGNTNRVFHFASTSGKKVDIFKQVVESQPGQTVQQLDVELEKCDKQPSCMKAVDVKLESASRIKGIKYPLLVEDSGFFIASTGEPGVKIEHTLKNNPDFWMKHKGKAAFVQSVVGLKCHANCAGHKVLKNSLCTIAEEARNNLYGYEKFSLFDGKYSDMYAEGAERVQPSTKALRAVLAQFCY